MKRQGDQHQSKMLEKENELRKTISDLRSRMRDEQTKQEDDGSSQLTDLLLQKQQQLEDVLRNNQVLNVRLERLQVRNYQFMNIKSCNILFLESYKS